MSWYTLLAGSTARILAAPAISHVVRAASDRRRSSPAGIVLLACTALLTALPAAAQTYKIYTAPVFLWNFVSVQNCGYCKDVPGPYETSLNQAFSDAEAVVNQTSAGEVWSAANLGPDPNYPYDITYDGNVYGNQFGVQSCPVSGGNCSYSANSGYIQTSYTCPAGFTAGNFNTNGTSETVGCLQTISNIQPPPATCKSCLGNPIYAANAEKRQAETDYSGASGLNFTRTYRSVAGAFASPLTVAFLNNSSSSPTALPGCYQSQWTYSGASGSYCFPYMVVYPYVNSGAPQYDLLTDDGRTIPFTGPINPA
jgi:hypothetical protein